VRAALGTRWRALGVLCLLLPVAGWALFESQRLFRSDWASAAERQKVLLWVSGGAAPASVEEWNAARAALLRSLSLTPDDPNLHERMGDLDVVAGQRDWAIATLRRAHFTSAAGYYGQALVLRPRDPQTWAMLAAARQAAGADRALVHLAWARALALGPHEGHVQPVLLSVVLADWSGATEAMQNWVKSVFDQGDARTRRAINDIAAANGLLFSPDSASLP